MDGGLGHLRAAEPILRKLRLPGSTLVAISKSPETPGRRRKGGKASTRRRRAGSEVHPPAGGRKPDIVRTLAEPKGVKFPRGSPALRLLMFVRDEAHRFAQHYHHIRRRKSSLGEDG